MEENELITFRKLAQFEHAEELVKILEENDIACDFKKFEGDLDPTFQGETETFKYFVRINETDREKAETLLENMAFSELEDVDPEYHLFQFTDDELMEILIKRDEWSEIDYVLSRKILKERGVKIDDDKIKEQYLAYQAKLSKPKDGQKGWIALGYIFGILGGFFGLLIGYMIWKAKTVLPNGTRVPAYNESIRKHGKQIFFLSIIMFSLAVIVRIYMWSQE